MCCSVVLYSNIRLTLSQKREEKKNFETMRELNKSYKHYGDNSLKLD